MRIVFAPRAIRRLREIQSYIALDNAGAAFRIAVRIRQTIELLADHPKLGRDWDGRSRALLVSGLPYRVHYRIDEARQTVEIITIAHTSQLPPRLKQE
ncbi:MAG: type II toxin-antitoxin system RelE/ParE family toxin [Pseudomonadota bacterium]